MSRKYKFRNPNGLYFVSFATVHWIDVFTRTAYKDILVNQLTGNEQAQVALSLNLRQMGDIYFLQITSNPIFHS